VARCPPRQSATAGHGVAAGTPFAVFVRLGYPRSADTVAGPVLIKALIDGVTAAFQAHTDQASLDEIARRIAATTSQPPEAVAAMLANAERAVLGHVDKFAYPRASGVQWNPGDHACMAGQVANEPAAGDSWTLSGQIQEVHPRLRRAPQ
jgi:hypothetical protein